MSKPTVNVYVKHYLTPERIVYFQKNWFPLVLSTVSKQPGFITITYELDHTIKDCVHIYLKFLDEQTFNEWVAYPSHDELIQTLDAYRSRDYWEAVRAPDEHSDPTTLEWIKY